MTCESLRGRMGEEREGIERDEGFLFVNIIIRINLFPSKWKHFMICTSLRYIIYDIH